MTEHKLSIGFARIDGTSQLMEHARRNDVERGGRFDARAMAINVWDQDWTTPQRRAESRLMGTVYLDRAKNVICAADVEAGFTLGDVVSLVLGAV